MMKILGVIPARGGSKGIPKKNIRLLDGVPLISYTIRSALDSIRINRVVVSTDDSQIATVAYGEGAEVLWRPPEISGDHSPSELALLNVLQQLQSLEAYRPDLIVFLQCTSPFTAAEDIDGTVDTLLRWKADCSFAATAFHYFLWRVDPSGNVIGINHDMSKRLMRQQQEPQFLEAGAVYVMKTNGFLQHRHRFFGKTVLHEIPSKRVFEIDDFQDLELAEFIIKKFRKESAK